MKREQVYQAIDGERAYQEKVWGEAGERRTNPEAGQGDQHQVGQFIVFIDHYLALAKSALTTTHGHDAALHQLRKVVALGVACFEQHGCPERRLPAGSIIYQSFTGIPVAVMGPNGKARQRTDGPDLTDEELGRLVTTLQATCCPVAGCPVHHADFCISYPGHAPAPSKN